MNKDRIDQEKAAKEKLAEVTKKMDTIEEKYYVLEEMNKGSFDKFYAKYSKEREEINDVLQKLTPQISNLKKSIEEGITFSTKLPTACISSPESTKEKLQKLVFPEGIIYSKKNEAFRTEKVNSFFAMIADAAKDSAENKKGNKVSPCLSLSAGYSRRLSNFLLDLPLIEFFIKKYGI